MPPYPGNNLAQALPQNVEVFFFNNEAVTAGELSQAFCIWQMTGDRFYTWGFSVEAAFSGNPGAFEIDIVGANTDTSTYYNKLVSITAASSVLSGFVGRVDSVNTYWPKFLAAYVKTLTNAVNLTLKLTR